MKSGRIVLRLASNAPYHRSKKWLLIVLSPFIFTRAGIAQTTEAEWQQVAIRDYPDLGVKDSPLNKSFIESRALLKASTPGFFRNPDWPLMLARQCAWQIAPLFRVAEIKTGDSIEFNSQDFERGNGSCTLVHGDVHSPARFEVSNGQVPIMIIAPKTGGLLGFEIQESGLFGAHVYAWPPALLAAVKDKGNAINSMSNARKIGTACAIYAMDHGGAFPKTIGELVPDYLGDKSILKCPLSPKETIGFEYFSGRNTDLSNQVLLRSKSSTNDGRRVIVRKDLSVSLVREN